MKTFICSFKYQFVRILLHFEYVIYYLINVSFEYVFFYYIAILQLKKNHVKHPCEHIVFNDKIFD